MYQLPKIVSYEKIIINSDMEISDYLNFKSFNAEEISITTNSQLIIRKGSFPDMENLKKLYIQSNSLVFEEGSIVNCKRLVDFKPKADEIVDFNANAIKNIRIEKFLIESNYYLNIGSFSDCSRLEQIELAEGTVAFTAGYFINCRRLKTVKTLCKGDDCMIYQDKSYLLKKINTSNLLEIVNSSELLFVNRGTKVAYVKNPFDLYSFTSLDSYSLKFYYDVPWDKLKEVCKVSDLRYIFGKNLTPPNRNQFKCNEKGCYVYCDKIEMHEEVSTPMPTIDIKLKDSAVESDNKKIKYSESSIITQIFTETLTQKAIVVASETLDENGSIINTESTSYIIEGTYMNVEVVAQTLILIEFKENGDTTKSQISNGQLLALICGECVIAFLVAFLGLFLYRRSHDKSDSEEEYSENEMEMEDDIGHVIYSDDERIISDEEIERINVL
ncbi:hypothetical protein TVAG_270060 [Trichomonas vaginalis G3]|uniref:Surface antigen BspA-like n=1 Tax=Trichomonas vaginalis (strain ATCC PRA-98 / G3) TaxID=412133 RepID=A2F998_TRIV3|nr:ribonuclease inhibitor domain-containing protein [Trichomonas vaginalis G3]EAX98521.1 hypothetical protein TVAG_270060 [Trichomonas vaginalis G3]KAI5529358.1 ribonuclease inhibitor domain-containing protein [Trichomonas vaginalis G3]|eukprot:XP_001311451.1 hypothetical protein [Trichomonas vaginalis G3]